MCCLKGLFRSINVKGLFRCINVWIRLVGVGLANFSSGLFADRLMILIMILMELDVLSLRVDDFFAMLAEVNSPIELAVELLHQLLRWQAQFL
jgi:hypothetical protein